MDYMAIVELVFSDKSAKVIALLIGLWMKKDFNAMKSAVENLTKQLAIHETKQEGRHADHEKRIIKVETKLELTTQGG